MFRNNKKGTNDGVNAEIFKYIDPNGNDKFSEMKGLDLQQLLVLLDKCYLLYRKKLGIEKDITFGIELEVEFSMFNKIKNHLRELECWSVKGDSTLTSGTEINSPVLNDNEIYWDELKKACDIVSKYAIVGTHSGGHIHIGAQIIGDKKEFWMNFIKLWSVYENIFYRFTYGNYLTPRGSMMAYARPVKRDYWKYYNEIIESNSDISIEKIFMSLNNRYGAVNLNNLINVDDLNKFSEKNTIEFRCPNSTLEPVIWQNNINLFVNLLLYSKSTNFNNDIIDKRYQEYKNNYDSLEFYGEIYIQQALELCDMIFKNNFDKVYFLRQYLKSFQIGKKTLQKSHKIIR